MPFCWFCHEVAQIPFETHHGGILGGILAKMSCLTLRRYVSLNMNSYAFKTHSEALKLQILASGVCIY